MKSWKLAITSAPCRAWYNPLRDTIVETDASGGVVAAVLTQKGDDGDWGPVAFYSKTMNDAEMRYPIHDQEMLAVVLALKEWHAELVGLQRQFLVITDHKALEYFTTKQRLNGRQARWADELAPHDFKITYRPGVMNGQLMPYSCHVMHQSSLMHGTSCTSEE